MNADSNIILFPYVEVVDARQRHGAALRQCLAAIAEEARDGGFALTEQALELAMAVLDGERALAAPEPLSALAPAE